MEINPLNKKFIFYSAALFSLGIVVGVVLKTGTIGGLTAQYLNDSSLTCTRECYLTSRGSFTVPGEESCPSEPVCGNGAIEGSETCDDGNATSDDGCSSTCSPDTAMNQIYMVQTYCGNGMAENPNNYGQYEQCDDGNTYDGDGCNSVCQMETIPTAYCGNAMCDSGEDCNSCSSDCGMCSYNSAPNYSYCYDMNACNYYTWTENGTCDYSCRTNTTCQDSTACNYNSEGSCEYESCKAPPDSITCTVVDDAFQFTHSDGSTDFSNSIISLGGTDPHVVKYDMEYSESQLIFRADVYINGIQVSCPPIITQNDGENGPLESCETMKQSLQEEGEDTSGMTCTGQYSFRVEKTNN